jgi:hypothetical protein
MFVIDVMKCDNIWGNKSKLTILKKEISESYINQNVIFPCKCIKIKRENKSCIKYVVKTFNIHYLMHHSV